MEEYLVYVCYYFIISLSFWLINSVVAGFIGEKWSWRDGLDSILWPLSLATLVGLVLRIIKNRFT